MATKSHAKFEQKLTLGSKNEMKNLVNFHPATQNSKNFTSVGYFCLKYMSFELIKYRGVIFLDTEQWCKHWAKVSLHGAIFSCACNAICCVACAWKNCTVSHRCFLRAVQQNIVKKCCCNVQQNRIDSILLHVYGSRLSHIFDKRSISKNIFLIYLVYQMIYVVYQISDIDILSISIFKH